MQLNSSRRRSRSRIHDTQLNLGPRREQFEATRRWKELLRRFSTEVLLQTHKRQLRTYPDTFTGKDALDCVSSLLPTIFTNKPYDPVVVANNILNNYLESKYIINVRDEQNRKFIDNATLYRLCKDRINQFLEDRAPNRGESIVARSASVRENHNSHAEEPGFKERLDLDSSQWKRMNGRLSISCQDIPTAANKMVNEERGEMTPQKSSARGNLSGFIMGISKASASIFSLNRSASQTNSRKMAANSNSKYLDENVLKDDQMPSSSNFNSDASSLRPLTNPKSVFKVRTNAPPRQRQEPSIFGRQQMTTKTTEDKKLPVFTEADQFKLWCVSLTSRFKQFIPIDQQSDCSFLPRQFSGADVRWNCKRVNVRTGIVERIKEQNEELPRDLIASLRSLCEYYEQPQLLRQDYQIRHSVRVVTSTRIQLMNRKTSPNSPPNSNLRTQAPLLFESVKLHLAKMAPIVPEEVAQCLYNILKYFTTIANSENIDQRAFLCLRLCLLTLPPTKLRAIQILCKFIQKIGGRNNSLMESNHPPKQSDAKVHPFAAYFTNIPDSGAIFSMLTQHTTDCLFAMTEPKCLEENVQGMMLNANAHSPSELSLTTTFCDQIDQSTYELQSKLVRKHMEPLLDRIMSNENLTEAEKFEKLKQFRITYPEIYAQKFPPQSDPLANIVEQRAHHNKSANSNTEYIGNTLLKQLKRMAF